MDSLRICDNMNTKVVDVKIKRLFNPTMVIQGILLLALLVVGIMFIFNNKIENIFYVVLAANLIILAINNHIFFHKKYMNYVYILFAIYLIISIIIDIW